MMNFQSLLKSFTKDNDNKNESGLKERQQQKQQQKQSQSQHNNQSISNSNNNNNKQINQSQQSRLLRLLQQKKKQVDDIKKGYQTFLLVSAQKISQYQKYHKENIQLKIKIQLLEKEIMMMNNRGIVIKQQSGNNNMMVNGLHNNNQDRQDYNKRFDIIEQLIKNIPKQINITTQLSTSKQQQNNQYPINKQINLQQQHKQKQQQQHMYRKRIREIQKKVMELQQQKSTYQQLFKQINQQNASYVEENKLLKQQNSSLKGKLYIIEQKNNYQWNHMKKSDNNNILQQQQLQLNTIQLARQQSATIPSITKQHSTTITKQQQQQSILKQQQYILKQQQQLKLRRQQTLTQSNTYNQLQKQLQIKKKTIQQLTQQLQLFQINQSKSQCKIKQAQTKINQLTSQLIQGQIQYNKLRQENTILSSKLKQYENKLKQCQDSLLISQKQIQRLKQIQSSSIQHQSYHRTIINQLTIQKNNLQTILKDIRQYLIKKYSLSQQINITNHNLSQELPNIINQIIQQENNKQSLYKQHYQQEIIKLREQISLYCQRIKQLQMIIQKHNNNNNNNYKHKYKIGTKLITSNIIHGHDLQRYQLLQQIQQFTNMKIKRTDILVRYPDIKSMIHQLPKQSNNFPFLLLYKGNNAVFGSYSDGIRKRTFIFSFIVDNHLNQLQQKQQYGSQQQQQQQILPKKIQQQTKQQQFLKQLERQKYDVRFYIPQRDKTPQQINKQYRVPSIQIFQSKYLQYGNGQLRINCIDMSYITANSDITGQTYYGLDWRQVMKQFNQQKVPLSQVELHKVQFYQQKHKVQFYQQKHNRE